MLYTLLFFSLQNAVCFIILTYLVPVSFTFYIQGVVKLKKNNSGAKRLRWPGHGVDHPPPYSAKVIERVELYLYSPSEPLWPVLG